MKFIIEVPGFSKISGGIQRMIELQKELQKVGFISQLREHKSPLELNEGDFVITFSDRPGIEVLCEYAKRYGAQVIVYQLSFGMCLERESKVVLHPDTIICCSTLKLQREILNYINTESKKEIHYIGHSQESTIENFYPEAGIVKRDKRLFDVAIMMHRATNKYFEKAFNLCKKRDMEICLFGQRINNVSLYGAKRVFFNADKDTMRWIFNNSETYLSYSMTEGLNRVGIEAMLCGCKPFIADGCEIYRNGYNYYNIMNHGTEVFSLPDYETLKNDLKEYTWKNVLKNLGKIINIKF